MARSRDIGRSSKNKSLDLSIHHHQHAHLRAKWLQRGVFGRPEYRLILQISSWKSRKENSTRQWTNLADLSMQVFHEGLKSWSCCKDVNKPELDFDQFMKIEVGY